MRKQESLKARMTTRKQRMMKTRQEEAEKEEQDEQPEVEWQYEDDVTLMRARDRMVARPWLW